MNVLIVAAHPDDEVLGCGGTILGLGRAGHRVSLVILGEGLTARGAAREGAAPAALADLRACSTEAARVLGAHEVTHHGLPDNRFDTLPLLEIVKLVEAEIARVRPRAVYTHHGGDLNVDHAVVHRAVLTATRPVPGQGVRELYAFETPSSTEWAFTAAPAPFRPNVFVDIGRDLEGKLGALACYPSEVREFPHPRSAEGLRAIARRWGTVAGCAAAEAFELVRHLRGPGDASEEWGAGG